MMGRGSEGLLDTPLVGADIVPLAHNHTCDLSNTNKIPFTDFIPSPSPSPLSAFGNTNYHYQSISNNSALAH